MKKIHFTVPESHLESVKEAMHDAGAGEYGNYDKQAWQVLGEGQFRPTLGASPFIGKVGELEQLREYKVEMYCKEQYLKKALEALKKTHPYEVVHFEVYSPDIYPETV